MSEYWTPERLRAFWRCYDASEPLYRELLEAAKRCDHQGVGLPGCQVCDVRADADYSLARLIVSAPRPMLISIKPGRHRVFALMMSSDAITAA